MRVRERGKYISLCEPNVGRHYDANCQLVAKSLPFNRKTHKRSAVRKARHMGRRICLKAGH